MDISPQKSYRWGWVVDSRQTHDYRESALATECVLGRLSWEAMKNH